MSVHKRTVWIHVTFKRVCEVNTLRECFDADIFMKAFWREPRLDNATVCCAFGVYVCMCVYVCVCKCVYVYVYVCVCVDVCMCVYICVWMRVMVGVMY